MRLPLTMRVFSTLFFLNCIAFCIGYYVDETDDESDVSFFLENIRQELSDELEKKDSLSQLSAADVLTRLNQILLKIDKNRDLVLDMRELTHWLKYVRNLAMERDTQKEWTIHNTKNAPEINWKDYKNIKHGNLEEEIEKEKFENSPLIKNLRRWYLADRNHDGNLTYSEFKDFLFPEIQIGFKSLHVLENLFPYDRNGDALISFHEYFEFQFHKPFANLTKQQIDSHIRGFTQWDYDGDYYLNAFEQSKMFGICKGRNQYDHGLRAEFIIKEFDRNGDGTLLKSEVLAGYTKAALSELTDRGNYLLHLEEL